MSEDIPQIFTPENRRYRSICLNRYIGQCNCKEGECKDPRREVHILIKPSPERAAISIDLRPKTLQDLVRYDMHEKIQRSLGHSYNPELDREFVNYINRHNYGSGEFEI